MTVTIKGIAAEAKVSHQAVSAVLNKKTNCRVSPETRERILKIAGEKGYRTNFGYKLMQGKSTDTVAIVICMRQMEHEEYVQNLVLSLMGRFNEIGHATYFNNMMTRRPRENVAQIKDLINRGAQHFIFIGSPIGYDIIADEIKRQNRTFIGFKSAFERNLNSDSRGATVKMLKFMMNEAGTSFRLLLPVTPGCALKSLGARFEALLMLFPDRSPEELFEKYVEPLPVLKWAEKDFTERMFKLGYESTASVMQHTDPPRALMFLSDNYALGGAAYLHKHGWRVGKDVLVSGFNNIEAVRTNVLPIISVEHRQDEIIRILLDESRRATPYNQTVMPVVHYRKS